MATDDILKQLIETAYAAAFDDRFWDAFADQAVEAFGGAGGSFVVIDEERPEPRYYRHVGAKSAALDEYWSGMVALDPQMKLSRKLAGTGIYVDTDHIDYTDAGTAEFMRWQADNVGWRHHMTGYTVLDGRRLKAGISIIRARDDGCTPEAERTKLAAILPELARAMELAHVHSAKLVDSHWEGLAFQRAEPAMLLDEVGRVIRTNGALDRLVSKDAGLDIRAGRIRAGEPGEDSKLARIVARALIADNPRSGAMAVSRSGSRTPLLLTIFPLPRHFRVLAPSAAAALVCVVDPASPPSGRAETYRDAFGLTLREQELAGLLMAGHSPESASRVLGVALPTARIHLRRLLAKTGTGRQSELIRLLTRLG